MKDVTFSVKNFLSHKQGTQPILKWQVKDVTTHTEAAGKRCKVFGLNFSKSKTHPFQSKPQDLNHTEMAGERCNIFWQKFSKSKARDPTDTEVEGERCNISVQTIGPKLY